MATITSNAVINGFRGKLGDALVFKTMRGKTFASMPARKPDKRKESAAQRDTRATFREAVDWAQTILLDPERKVYYSKRAKAMKLPNAYTAALTDYMRKPKLKAYESDDNTIACAVSKHDFKVKKVEVVLRSAKGEEVRTITSAKDRWIFKLTREEAADAYIIVTDDIGKVYAMEVDSFKLAIRSGFEMRKI